MSGKKISKMIFKGAMFFLLLLLLFLVAVYFAIQNPKIQTFLAQKITYLVSESIGAEVEIGSVNIEFFNDVYLDKFLIRDQKKDTLFYFEKAHAKLDYFSLFDKNIQLNAIEINGFVANMYRSDSDTSFNFAFLTQNNKVNIEPKKPLEWTLSLNQFLLQNPRISFNDSLKGLLINAQINALETFVNQIDLKESAFLLQDIILKYPIVSITQLPTKKGEDKSFVLDIPLLLQSKNIKVIDGHFTLLNQKDTIVYKYMKFNHLIAENVNLAIENTYLHSDSVFFDLKQLDFCEQNGFVVKELITQVNLSNQKLILDNLHLSTNNSTINTCLALNYKSFSDFKDFANSVRFQAEIENAHFNPADLAYFMDVRKLGIQGKFVLDGTIKGRLNSLKANDILLKAGKNTSFQGDFSLNGLPNIKETFISLDVKSLVTNYDDLMYIHNKIPLPINAKTLGRIRFNGRFDGFYSDFVTYGEVYTDLGYVNTDVNFKLNDGNPSYSGNVYAKDFKVGKWFGIDDQLGEVSLKTTINGSGVKLETLDAVLKGNISSLNFKGYTYTNIVVDGSFKDKFFKGNAKINDENLVLDFDGLVDASAKSPLYNFKANLEKINVKPLHLMPQDYTFSGQLQSNFSAKNIDNILGELAVQNFGVSYEGKTYKLNKLDVKSFSQNNENHLHLTADNINMTIAGNYKISTLPKAIKSIFIPSDSALQVSPQNLRFDAEITDKTELITLFVPQLSIPKKIKISGNLDTQSESALALISIPSLQYNQFSAENFISNIYVKNGNIDMINALPKVFMKDSLIAKDVSLIANGTKENLNFNIHASNKLENSSFSLLGNLSYLKNLFTLSLDPKSTILINNDFWNLAENNSISFNKNVLTASNFKLYNTKSEANFRVNKKNGTNNLVLDLKNIAVEDFAEILREKGIDLKGKLNGEIKIDNFDKEPAINGDIALLNIYVNEYNVGDFKINSRLDIPDKKVYMSGGLFSKENHIDINGSYSFDKISTNEDFDIDIFIKQFTIKSLEDFIPQFISNSSGTVNGNLKLIGARKTPNLNGYVDVNDVTTTVSYTQVPYTIAKTKVLFKNNEIILDNKVIVQDDEGNQAFGSGKITHQNFKNWALDIAVKTPKIKALNTKIQDNEIFYGTAYIDGGATFTGFTDEPLIYIYGQSVENSYLDVPLSEGVDNAQFQFYTFVSKIKEDQKIKPPSAIKIMGAKVKLDLDIDQDLDLKIILDQDAGDVLKVNGEGNIKIDVGRGGEYVNFFGTYNVTKGDYLFTMQNIVNKPFSIEPNSKINFNGDIYNDATIDMSATYSRKVALDDFIAEYISDTDDELKNLAKNRVPVTLYLDLKEKLSQPTIKFNIGVDRIDPKLRSYVETKLQTIQLNEAELNNQIFGVLVLSRFLPSYSALENSFGNDPEDAVLNTVTELVTSQLSRYLTDWSSLIVKDLEFFVNFSSYDPSYLSDETLSKRRELQLALSKRFFNDRLQINVGGNFDFGESFDSQNNSGTTFFGANVSFEYAVTKNRRWRIKAFTISDYDNYNLDNNRNTRSGLGFSYKREFDDVYELFNIKRKVEKTSNTNN